METEKNQGGNPVPQGTNILHEESNRPPARRPHEVPHLGTMDNISEEAKEEEGISSLAQCLALLFVEEERWGILSNPVERKTSTDLEISQRDPENRTGLSEENVNVPEARVENNSDLSGNSPQGEHTVAYSPSGCQSPLFNTNFLSQKPRVIGDVAAEQAKAQALLDVFPQALNTYDTFSQTLGEATLGTDSCHSTKDSSCELFLGSHDVSECFPGSHDVSEHHQHAESATFREEEDSSRDQEVPFGMDKERSQKMEATEGAVEKEPFKARETDRVNHNPLTRDGEEAKASAFDLPKTDCSEGEIKNLDVTKPNGVLSRRTSELSYRDGTMDDLGQNSFSCTVLHLQEEEDGTDRGSIDLLQEETPIKHVKSNVDCRPSESTQEVLSTPVGPEPEEMDGAELLDTEPNEEEGDLDWKEMEKELKTVQEKLDLGHNEEENMCDSEVENASTNGAQNATPDLPFTPGLDTLCKGENNLALSDFSKNESLAEAEGFAFSFEELFSPSNRPGSDFGLSEPFVQTANAKTLPSVRKSLTNLNSVSENLKTQPAIHHDFGQWEYNVFSDQAVCIFYSGQHDGQTIESGRKGSSEKDSGEHIGGGQNIRRSDSEEMYRFLYRSCTELTASPDLKDTLDSQAMNHSNDAESPNPAPPLWDTTATGPLQEDTGQRADYGTTGNIVQDEEKDFTQQPVSQHPSFPCQLDTLVSEEASVLSNAKAVQASHLKNTSEEDLHEEAQGSAPKSLQSTAPGKGLSTTHKESTQRTLVSSSNAWDTVSIQEQGTTMNLEKLQRHLKLPMRSVVFSGKEAGTDAPSPLQRTSVDELPSFLALEEDRDGPSSPNSSLTTAPDTAFTPMPVSDQSLVPGPFSSHFSQPLTPMPALFSAPPHDKAFLVQSSALDLDSKHATVLEPPPSPSQTSKHFFPKHTATPDPESPTPIPDTELPIQLLAAEPGSNQNSQLPDLESNSEQSLSLAPESNQPALHSPHNFRFCAPKAHQPFQPALVTANSSQIGEATATEINTSLLSQLPPFAINDPSPVSSSNIHPIPNGNQFSQQPVDAPVSNLLFKCMEGNDQIHVSNPVASFCSPSKPTVHEAETLVPILNAGDRIKEVSVVQFVKSKEEIVPQGQQDLNIHNMSSGSEVSLLDSYSLQNNASLEDPFSSIHETPDTVIDLSDGKSSSCAHTSQPLVESWKMLEAEEVRDSTQSAPLLAFTNPIHFFGLGPPSPPTTRQQTTSREPKRQQQQLDNAKINSGDKAASTVIEMMTEGSGRAFGNPVVERSPTMGQRKEEVAKHPPLEKSSSCPGKGVLRLDPKEAESSSKKQQVITKHRAKSKDWHRQGVRKISVATDNALAEAIASLVPSKVEGPAQKDRSDHLDRVKYGEGKSTETIENMKRRQSKLINSSRLLYQEYSDVALNKAIQSQKRADSLTEELEFGSPYSPRLRRKVMPSQDSYLQRLSVSSTSSLWQDIPMVRGSTMLLSMTREEQKLQEAKFELIASEASYLRSLNVAVDHFQHSQELQAVLTNQEKQWLFSRLQDVRDVSANFLFDLEEKLEENMFTFNVCDVALRHAPEFYRVYLPYVTNQTYQDQTFQRLLSTVPAFQQVLERLESDPVCQRLSLKSFLILPFQRITRLKLLLQNILKRTRPGADEEVQATQAYDALEKLIKDCNQNVQRMKSTEELIHLSQNMEFECKIFPLISQSRRLVKRGELTALEYNLSLKWKLTTRPIYLHLFNDYLLLSRPRENGRFIVFDYAASSDVRGEKCEMKLHGTNKNVFRLFLLQNNQGKKVEFLFRTETQSEKLRWISALTPHQAEPDLLDDLDLPQVQCVKSYKARENDELALEKADIIMVLRQSTDGWMEGVKLSDGERGWFPSEQVEIISSKHARQMNLKEELRVKNAKQQVFRKK